jgi:hypothetical protein
MLPTAREFVTVLLALAAFYTAVFHALNAAPSPRSERLTIIETPTNYSSDDRRELQFRSK